MNARFGFGPHLLKEAQPIAPELRNFLSLVTLVAIVLISAWSLLVYTCVCLPYQIWLQVMASALFLLLPISFHSLHLLHWEIENAAWPLQRLNSKKFLARKWLEHFGFSIGLLVSIGLGCYLLTRTLVWLRVLPRAFYVWIIHRVTQILGVSIGSGIDGSIPDWIAGFFYFIAAVICFVDFLLLVTGLMVMSRAFVTADLIVIDNLFSSLLYGRWSRFLAGVFTLVVILSVAGGIHKAVEGIGELFGRAVGSWELDLLLAGVRQILVWTGKSSGQWIASLHIPLLVLLFRVVFPRLLWVRSLARSMWTPDYAFLGCVVLVVPLFFGADAQQLSVSHFYDGYRLIAETLFGILYSMLLIPGFVLLVRERYAERL